MVLKVLLGGGGPLTCEIIIRGGAYTGLQDMFCMYCPGL